jgi:hypothetical protein
VGTVGCEKRLAAGANVSYVKHRHFSIVASLQMSSHSRRLKQWRLSHESRRGAMDELRYSPSQWLEIPTRPELAGECLEPHGQAL